MLHVLDWNAMINKERQKAEEMRYLHGGGVGTVFVLDTSASMEGEGFKEMKEIFLSIVDEISRSTGPIHDNVSVVTFGKEVKFVQYPTNRYQDLRHCLDDVQCGGSSPLTAGIILSTAVFNEPGSLPLGDWHVRTRIIVITDGRPTDSSIISGSDDPERYNQIQVKETFCSQIHQIGKLNQITFVPVGHSDMLFFEMALGVSKTARMIHACDSRQLGKYATNVFIAAHIQHEDITTMDMDHFQRIVSDAASGLGASDTDLEEIKNIISYKDVYRSQEEILDADDEEFSSSLIPVGTRVRRGPHWKWRNQDSDGPGTVVGYNTGFSHYGWTRVEWDNGVSLSYRYNLPGLSEPIFDVVECHEPRVLIDGELIAVGCRVTRGPDWKWDDQDGGKGQVGAVYRLSQSGIVHVRWPNGTRSNYRFGFDGKFDVQLIDPLESTPNTLMSNLPVKVEFENDLTTKDKTKSENSEVSNISSGNSNIPWPRDANINDQANGYRNLRGECNPADDQISSNPADIQSLNRQTDDQTSLSHSCSDNQFSGPHADDQTSSYSVDNPISTSKTSSKKVSTHNLNDWNVQSNRQISTFKGSDNSSFLTNSEESSTKKSESDLETSSAKVCNDFIWQWKNSSGNWTTYPDDINEIINERYSQNPAGVITILHNNQCVRIVMSSFQQVTPLTGATTKIRRLCPVDNKK